MSSFYHGEVLELSIFGQSHSPAIGMSLSGLPAGFAIDMDELSAFLRRARPRAERLSTPRKEADAPEFLSGLVGNVTCGAPLSAIIRNTNTRSQDYSNLVDVPRPGHADYTAQVKFGGFQDVAGGGHFSGRLTAPLCIAGGICKQLLHEKGIEVMARIDAVAGIQDTAEFDAPVAQKDFPATSDEAAGKMKAAIAQARAEEDSVGGVIQCRMLGVPAGLGEPMFGGLENRISQLVFAIPAVKGIEFGLGFEAAKLRGSENNDAYRMEKRQRRHGDKPLRRHSRRHFQRHADHLPRCRQAYAIHRKAAGTRSVFPKSKTKWSISTADTTRASSRARCRAWKLPRQSLFSTHSLHPELTGGNES